MGNYFGCSYDESSLTKCEMKNYIKNLKDAVLCIGCTRFLLIFAYLGIIVLLNCYINDAWPILLKIMLSLIVVPEFVLILLLFIGAPQGCAAYYVGVFFLVYWFTDGTWKILLSSLTLCAAPIYVFCGVILFYGALDEKIWALEVAIWLCLAMATYNTVLGIMGLLYFLREGKQTVHFVIALFFFLLALSLFAVIFHDIVIIYTLKKSIVYASSCSPDMVYE